MDNLNLASDESILRKLPKIIVNGTRCKAILTSLRVILVDRASGQIYMEIPYTSIASAETRVNAIHEPVLAVTSDPSGEAPQTADLVFVYQPGGQNISDIERCMAVLQDHGIPVQSNGVVSVKTPRSRTGTVSPVMKTEEGEEKGRHPAADRTVAGRPWQSTRAPPPDDDPHKKGSYGTLILIIAIIAAIIGSAFLVGISLHNPPKPAGKDAAKPTPTMTPEITTEIPTEIPTEVPVTTASPTQPPVKKPKVATLPEQGVWAKVTYDGPYEGYFTGDGRRVAVNGSVTDYFRLPYQNTSVDGFIEKRDGSSELLQVELFNGGNLVTRGGTRTPYGIAEIHAPVGLALGYAELTKPPTPVITALPTPDSSLTLRQVPQAGVWVRVAYPGTFDGSIASNGDWRKVSGTGDQFYQLPMTSGIIEASIDKTDDLGNNLVVGVYNNGVQVLVRNTTAPRGNIKIYTTV